jgi:hypothetical protein
VSASLAFFDYFPRGNYTLYIENVPFYLYCRYQAPLQTQAQWLQRYPQ